MHVHMYVHVCMCMCVCACVCVGAWVSAPHAPHALYAPRVLRALRTPRAPLTPRAQCKHNARIGRTSHTCLHGALHDHGVYSPHHAHPLHCIRHARHILRAHTARATGAPGIFACTTRCTGTAYIAQTTRIPHTARTARARRAQEMYY